MAARRFLGIGSPAVDSGASRRRIPSPPSSTAEEEEKETEPSSFLPIFLLHLPRDARRFAGIGLLVVLPIAERAITGSPAVDSGASRRRIRSPPSSTAEEQQKETEPQPRRTSPPCQPSLCESQKRRGCWWNSFLQHLKPPVGLTKCSAARAGKGAEDGGVGVVELDLADADGAEKSGDGGGWRETVDDGEIES